MKENKTKSPVKLTNTSPPVKNVREVLLNLNSEINNQKMMTITAKEGLEREMANCGINRETASNE